MLKVLQTLLVGIIVDLYWFPVAPTFAPSVNSKMIMAIVGVLILSLQVLRKRNYSTPKSLFGATFFALAYSACNLVAVELNDTFDFSYASYITTFFVWLFAAYTAIEAIRWRHQKVTISLLTLYLSVVCSLQCIIAIIIDKFEAAKAAVNSIFYISEEFFEEIDRLYGIGAALDPAGTRFAIVLIMIAFVLSLDEKVKKEARTTLVLLISFIIISVIGNMISRTTSSGMILGLLVMLFNTGLYRMTISADSLRMFKIFAPIMILGITATAILYNTDSYTRSLLRYGFEGFFNWVETGVWTTGSTETLATMWRWPETTKGWIIGTGRYGLFDFGTDIGYCRLILYSGLVGFSVFALLFVYNAYVFITKYRRYRYMFLVLLGMSFIIWYKASTDLFMIYALLYCFDDEEEMGYAPKFSL